MITDSQKALLLEQYLQRGLLKQEVRSYEVSLWTLQDEFMTVLKWSDVEQKGRIEKPKMTLNIDGTQKFSFSIPMYYRENGKLVENPNWYNTQNGNLMASLRKIKVIFNKDEVDVENVDWKTLFDKVYVPKGYNGNVDLYNRMIVPVSSFTEAGYGDFEDEYGTLYSIGWTYTASDGKDYDVAFTPITADGLVRSKSYMETYFSGIISQYTDIETWLKNDKHGEKMILGIFPVSSTGDHGDQWGVELHELQAEWDQIRAKIGMLDSSNNPIGFTFTEPTYDCYKKYLRSLNTFEFIITSVTETHEKDILTCEIESEGLAFQELGKIGYKVNLSQANFELVYKDWHDNHHDTMAEPKETVDYWCSEAGLQPLSLYANQVNSRAWYYDVRMNWKSFENTGTNVRSPKKVYEESYTSSWKQSGDIMIPSAEEAYREKARPVEIDKSNLYNVTQTIAETFEIFCRYEFIYDDNYHIIGRIIVFYNNFMNEDDMFTLQYPYSAQKVSRNMDSTNTTTKLFILDPDSTTVESGQSSVMNAPPNASKEDYILNFDYMYTIGAINKEQYDAIKPFEADMNKRNTDLSAEQLKLATYQTQKSEIEAKRAVANKSIDVDKEQILQNNIKRNAITDDHSEGTNDGYIHITYKNPDYCIVRVDSQGRKYITPAKTSTGIKEDTIKIYASSYILQNEALGINQVKSFMTEHDDYNNLTNIILQDSAELVSSSVDFNDVYTKLYTEYNITEPTCNVDLKNRPIVLSSTMVAAGYRTDVDPTQYTYYVLYPQCFQTTAGTPSGAIYDIICTPIMKDGTVKNPTEMRSYIDDISTRVHSLSEWTSIDGDQSKLILGVLPHDNEHPAANLQTFQNIENNQLRNWNKIKGVMGMIELPTSEVLDNADITLIGTCTTTDASDNYVPAVYLTYNYDPHFYFDNIIETWQSKLNDDKEEFDKYDTELGPKDPTDANFASGLYGKIKASEESVQQQLKAKQEKIKEFEHLMGPALREGYWQPEHYDDYGDRKEISNLTLTNPARDIKVDTKESAIIAWDTELFDEEEKLYYEVGVSKKVEYYPCIKLNDAFPQGIPTDLEEYSLVWWANSSVEFPGDSTAWDSVKDLTVLAVGSQAIVRYIKFTNGTVEPVLVVVGAKSFTGDMLQRMIMGDTMVDNHCIGGHARLEKYNAEVAPDGKSIIISHGTNNEIKPIHESWWLCYRDTNNSVPVEWPSALKSRYSTRNSKTQVRLVYPRIKFSSLALKTDSTNLKITYNNTQLEVGQDYRVQTRNTLRSEVYYPENFITIKPETLVKLGGIDQNLTINYLFSNMNTSIYLDGIKVSKENAYPKVSYEVSSTVLNTNFVRTIYQKLAQIVMVNDTDLKFENTFGYISQLELDLDNCQNDTIEVKNYKTKFEDLFSTIVAQTEAMKASGAGITTALSGGIPLSEDGFAATLASQRDIMDAYMDSYFDGKDVITERMTELLGEAGKIISGAQKSLNSTAIASIEAYQTLSGLAENVEAQLTAHVTRSPKRPDVFNVGDIWIRTDKDPPGEKEIGRYVAIMSSDQVTDLTDETAGFSRTHDGSLAAITGAAIDIDAEAGTIDMKAATNISMRSGGDIYIAANSNVDIIGNKKVNIGGTEINLCTLNEKIVDEQGNLKNSGFKHETTGINLIAGEYSFDAKGIYSGHDSRILIKPHKMEIGASELKLEGSAITLLASTGTAANTSAITLNPEEGIYIGAGKGLTLWGGNNPAGTEVYVGPVHSVKFHKGDYWIKTSNVSGHYEYDGENGSRSFYTGYILSSGEMTNQFTIEQIYYAINNYDDPNLGTIEKNNTVGWEIAKNSNGSNMSASRANAISVIQNNGPNGAQIELNEEHLILGYSNIQKKASTAIELTDEYVIIAAGSTQFGQVQDRSQLEVTGQASSQNVNSLVGAMFTKESIGFATQTNNTINALIMNDNGLTLGSTNGGIDLANSTTEQIRAHCNATSGESYVRVSSDGIELGSSANLYVNTNNFKVQTGNLDVLGNAIPGAPSNLGTRFAIGENLQFITRENTKEGTIRTDDLSSTMTSGWVGLVFNGTNLFVNGNVAAKSFTATTDLTIGENTNALGAFKVSGGEMAFYKFDNKNNYPTWSSGTKMLYFNTATGDLYIAGTLQAANIQILEGGTRQPWGTYFSNMSLDYMATVKATITGLFNEAGKIIGAAARSLKDVQDLNGANNAILTSFYEDISTKLTPNTSKGPYHEYYFKTGDIWQKTATISGQSNLDNNGNQKAESSNPYNSSTVIATYIAMNDWDNVYEKNKTNAANGKDSTKGWNRTSDSRLADIKGASIDVDTEAGTVSVKAASTISILAKALIDLSSDNIEITGSNSVNISGGNSVNIASGGSINLVTSSTYNSTQAVKISKDGIVIASAAQIEIKSSKGIYIKSSTDSSANVIEISETNGVWIGSGKAVNLSSTASEVKGANFSMTPERILIGVTKVDDTNNASTTAIDMNSKEIIIAAGNKLQSLQPDGSGNITNIEATDISGIQIKSNYIGMATGSGANRSLISLAPSKILIGVGTLSGGVPSGSYVRIENNTTNHTSTFEIGSTGIFKVLTPNFYVATDNTSGDQFRVGNTSGPYIAYNPNNMENNVNVPLLTVKGTIHATGFILDSAATEDLSDYTGMTIINWAKNYDENGDSIADPKDYLMLTPGNSVLGGIVCGSTDNQPRNFIIPWIPDRKLSDNTYFQTPAFLINKDGLQYRYMTDDGTGNPNVQSSLSINGDGISLTSGHVTVNGQSLWEGSILYSVNQPTIHPEHNWVWIKPMSNAYSETVLTTPSNQGRISYGDNEGATQVFSTAALSQIGAQTGDYRVDIWITAMVVNASNTITPQAFKQGNIQLNVGITGGANNSITVCTVGSSNSIYATDISKEYKLGDMIRAYGGYNYTNHNNPLGESNSALTLTIKNNSNLYLRITEIQIRFSVEAVDSMTPCNVYYFP